MFFCFSILPLSQWCLISQSLTSRVWHKALRSFSGSANKLPLLRAALLFVAYD